MTSIHFGRITIPYDQAQYQILQNKVNSLNEANKTRFQFEVKQHYNQFDISTRRIDSFSISLLKKIFPTLKKLHNLISSQDPEIERLEQELIQWIKETLNWKPEQIKHTKEY